MARSPTDGRSAYSRAFIAPGETGVRRDLEFPGHLRLTGRLFVAGEPLGGAIVRAVGEEVTSTASGLTDVDGRFELAGLEEGAYQVKASRAGGTLTYPQRVTLPVNRDLVFDLGAARIEGAVVDARNARAVSGAVLSLRSRGDGGLRGFSVDGLVATGPGGRFVFHDVSSGDYSLVVEAPGFASGLRVVEVPSGVTAEWVTFELGSDHDS